MPKVTSRKEFTSTLRTILQGFSDEIPISPEGLNVNVYEAYDCYGVLSLVSNQKGAKNVIQEAGDYDMVYINNTSNVRLRFVAKDGEQLNDVLDSFITYIETSDFRYKLTSANINIIHDYDVRTYIDTSPFNATEYVHVGVIDIDATYVSVIKDFVGIIEEADIAYGLEDGGVYIHDVVTVPKPNK